jgi:hypothetical protein
VVLECGWTMERITHDYGYDLSIFTFDPEGYAEPGALLVQVKATENLSSQTNDDFLSWTLDVRDLRLWCDEGMPVLLVVYDVPSKRGYWLHVQEAFTDHEAFEKHLYVRCRIPRENRLTPEALIELREKKQANAARLWSN